MPGNTNCLQATVMKDGELPDPIHEHFAQLVANGASYLQAIKIADPTRPAPHNAGSRMAKLPQVMARISEIASGRVVSLTDERGHIKEVDKRLDAINQKWQYLEDVIECRSEEYVEQYPQVAGGHTGLFCWELKDGEKWHHVDYKLLQESRDLLRLAHEWDKRSASLKALHLHAHTHHGPEATAEAKVKALPEVDLDRIINIAESVKDGEPKA